MLRSSGSALTIPVALALLSLGGGFFALASQSIGNWPGSLRSDAANEGSTLRSYFEDLKAGRPFELEEGTSQVFRGTEHSDFRRICFSENWLQWLGGQGYPPLMRTQDTDLLIDGGLANCSERAQILKTLAETAGRSCRFVGLQGHVVLEVEDQGRWRMADPDYGVVYPSGVEVLSEPASAPLVREILHGRGYPSEKVDRYLLILQSADDNVFLPQGQPLSPRLFALEATCRWLIWVLPAICLLAGATIGWVGWRHVFAVKPQVETSSRKLRQRRLRPVQLPTATS